MAAYLIFTRRSIKDAAEMARYGELVPASLEGHEMAPLVRYGALEVLEGEAAEGVVIIQFETVAAARGWYGSEAYQQAAEHRKLGADYDVLLVEGI